MPRIRLHRQTLADQTGYNNKQDSRCRPHFLRSFLSLFLNGRRFQNSRSIVSRRPRGGGVSFLPIDPPLLLKHIDVLKVFWYTGRSGLLLLQELSSGPAKSEITCTLPSHRTFNLKLHSFRLLLFRTYLHPRPLLVLTIVYDRFLDACHTTFVAISLWDDLVNHFGDSARADYIPWYVIDLSLIQHSSI